jgi:hypothetical protein
MSSDVAGRRPKPRTAPTNRDRHSLGNQYNMAHSLQVGVHSGGTHWLTREPSICSAPLTGRRGPRAHGQTAMAGRRLSYSKHKNAGALSGAGSNFPYETGNPAPSFPTP